MPAGGCTVDKIHNQLLQHWKHHMLGWTCLKETKLLGHM